MKWASTIASNEALWMGEWGWECERSHRAHFHHLLKFPLFKKNGKMCRVCIYVLTSILLLLMLPLHFNFYAFSIATSLFSVLLWHDSFSVIEMQFSLHYLSTTIRCPLTHSCVTKYQNQKWVNEWCKKQNSLRCASAKIFRLNKSQDWSNGPIKTRMVCCVFAALGCCLLVFVNYLWRFGGHQLAVTLSDVGVCGSALLLQT